MSAAMMGGEFPAAAAAAVGSYRAGRWRDVKAACSDSIEGPGLRRPQTARNPRLPKLWEIVSYWLGQDRFIYGDAGIPHCFACSWLFPAEGSTDEERWNRASRHLDRGHIVNWVTGGLDQVQNLVPLCKFCNMVMPVFRPEEWPAAVMWIEDGGPIPEFEERLEAKGLLPDNPLECYPWPPPGKDRAELARLIRLTYPASS